MINTLLDTLGIKIPILMAGFFGAIATVLYRGEKSFLRGFSLIFVGSLTTAYITPPVVSRFDLDEGSSYAAAFIIGVLGMYIVGALLSLGALLKDHPMEMLKNFMGLPSKISKKNDTQSKK